MSLSKEKAALVSAVVVSCLTLYYLDAFCVLRRGKIVLQSHGEEAPGGLVIKNGCQVHHLSPEGGIHVVGVGRVGIQSVPVGYIEDFNRIQKLQEVDKQLTLMGKTHRFVGLVANGGTHHKPALARIRDDIAIQINQGVDSSAEWSLVDFFKKYDMGKFLSVEHGCCSGYITLYDTALKIKVAERTGPISARIEHVFNV